MMRSGAVLIAPLALAACAEIVGAPQVVSPPETPAVAAPPPPHDARTVEEFDTTTEAQKAAATTAPAAADRRLGETVATLGDPADPGFWLRTPLVSEVTEGRVVAASGASAQVELRPSGGPASAGSEASLALLRLLDLPLTGLPTLQVFAAR